MAKPTYEEFIKNAAIVDTGADGINYYRVHTVEEYEEEMKSDEYN